MNNPDKNPAPAISLDGLVAAHNALKDRRANGDAIVDTSPEAKAVVASMMAARVHDLMEEPVSGSHIIRFDPDALAGRANSNPDGLI